jgi:hypothetical protein
MEMNLRFSALPVVLLSYLSGFLPSAVFSDVLFNFDPISIPSQHSTYTGPYCHRCPGIPNTQNVITERKGKDFAIENENDKDCNKDFRSHFRVIIAVNSFICISSSSRLDLYFHVHVHLHFELHLHFLIIFIFTCIFAFAYIDISICIFLFIP